MWWAYDKDFTTEYIESTENSLLIFSVISVVRLF